MEHPVEEWDEEIDESNTPVGVVEVYNREVANKPL